MVSTRWSALAIALLVALPAAVASWGGKGSAEPDTPYDLGAMWLESDTNPDPTLRLVYFNGFSGAAPGAGTSVNPNLAQARSAIVPAPFYPVAILGVWKDCNRDGYIGMGDNGALEYPAALLDRTDVCPPVTAGPLVKPYQVHNDGRWVQELTPIGYDDVRNEPSGDVDSDPRNYNDTGARVWADWGVPDSPPAPPCALLTMYRGSLHSTGGVLAWLDCHDRYYLTQTVNEATTMAGQPELGFSDVPPDQADRSASPLNARNPYGEASDEPMARVFDCSAPAENVAVRDPTGGMLHHVEVGPVSFNLTDSEDRFVHTDVRNPSPTLPDGGSVAGSVNETQAATSDCDRGNPGETVDVDGKPDGSDASLPYFLEGSTRAPSRFAPRTQSDFVLAFEEGDRRSGIAMLAGRWSSDGNTGAFAITGMWSGVSATRLEPAAYLDRENPGASPVNHITYYAYVSPQLAFVEKLTLPSGGGTYGAATCATSEPVFECDASRWWRDDEGRDAMPRDARLGSEAGAPTVARQSPETELGVRVWHAYSLRDVDCLDFSASPAREAGVHWGALTATSC